MRHKTAHQVTNPFSVELYTLFLGNHKSYIKLKRSIARCCYTLSWACFSCLFHIPHQILNMHKTKMKCRTHLYFISTGQVQMEEYSVFVTMYCLVWLYKYTLMIPSNIIKSTDGFGKYIYHIFNLQSNFALRTWLSHWRMQLSQSLKRILL